MNPCKRPALGSALLALMLLATSPLPAHEEPQRPPWPILDVRQDLPQQAPEANPARDRALATFRQRLPDVRITFDPVTGSPRKINARTGRLTGPRGQGRGVPPGGPGVPLNDPHRGVKALMAEYRELFGHGPEMLDAAALRRDHRTAHNGLRTVVWDQQLDGIPVFGGRLTANLSREDELISLSSTFVTPPAARFNQPNARPQGSGVQPVLSAPQAVSRAAANIDEPLAAYALSPVEADATGAERRRHFLVPGLTDAVETRLTWLPMQPGRVQLCWEVTLTSKVRGEVYRFLVDAVGGKVLVRHCLTFYLSDATFVVYTSDSPSPFSPAHPMPSTNQPPTVSRQVITWSALDTNASPNGWINDGDNQTLGNNVDAYLDRDADNLPDGTRPTGTPARVFDFPFDLGQSPTTYGNASVVQLFYWCNWMHDRLYELGFDEAAGNFQTANLGRGGAGGDALRAEAQDGSGFNNANMLTPVDGSPPRMQMYLFDSPTPDRDATLDAEIVLHEYTHGLTGRTVGGGGGLNVLQARGMSEGWSDFYALAMLSEPGDDPHGTYPEGGYSTYGLDGLLENYYFGIRRFPYCTDLNKNPLRFADIDPAQIRSYPGVPRSPRTPFDPSEADQFHRMGELWCVSLWEARANLIDKYGHETGNQLMLQIATDALRLTPAEPTFLEARDAIIEADAINNNGANGPELWAAFAKRGMGFSAISPPSTTTTGVQEAFDVPDDLRITPLAGFSSSGEVGGPFSINARTYTLANAGSNLVPWTATHTSLWLQVLPENGQIPEGSTSTQVVISLTVSAAILPAGIYWDVVWFTNLESGAGLARPVQLLVGQPHYFAEIFEQADNDLAFTTYTFTPDGSVSFYEVCHTPATNFPTSPSLANPISLGDDDAHQVVLGPGHAVSIYGHSTNVIWINSNGNLTTDGGDYNFVETLTQHFAHPRVAALFDDLNPNLGGSVSYQELSNRVVVTFLDVPEYDNSSSLNSFQFEWFYDGTIRITFLEVQATDGLVGLSLGQGVPENFAESDFSSLPLCQPPITLLIPLMAAEGDGILANAGTVIIPEALTNDVTIELASSVTSEVVVPANVLLPAGQTNVSFDLVVQDDPDLDGSQAVRITASAPGLGEASASMTIHDNESATLTLMLPASANEGQALIPVLLEVDTPPAVNVLVELATDDPSELGVPPFVLIPQGQTTVAFNLSAPNDSLIDGPQTASLTAHVANWTDGMASIVVLDDETLDLAVSLPPAIFENGSAASNLANVRLTGTLPTNLTVQLASSDLTELAVPAEATILAGETVAAFALIPVDDPDVDGIQVVTLTASAPGFIDGQATLQVLDDESPLPPDSPSPPDMATNIAAMVELSWKALGANPMVNGDFESGDFSGWTRSNIGNGDFYINDGLFQPASGDPPTPPFEGTYSALSDQFGTGLHTLYQEIVVPPTPSTLRWAQRIRNHAFVFGTNQFFRVELRSPTDELLAEVYSTQPGDAPLTEWTEEAFDLAMFLGRTVRLAFIEHDALNYFNAHVDHVRIDGVSGGGGVTNDVYFGTDPEALPLLGSTTNSVWSLPLLAPNTTYYWQIVARKGGVTAGPVWRFTTRGLDHFTWDPIGPIQVLNMPFPVTVTAHDQFGTPITNFTGPVTLEALVPNQLTTVFTEDFEDGMLDGWADGSGIYFREISTNTAAGGTHSLHMIGGNEHYDGISHPLPELTPERVEFYVRKGTTTEAGAYVVLGDDTSNDHTAIFFYADESGELGIFEDQNGGHTVPYVPNRWYKITLNLDWTTRRIDFYVDDVLVEANIPFRGQLVNSLTAVYLYNFDSTEAWWDDIILTTDTLPIPIPLSPTLSGTFTDGVWSGEVSVLQPGTNVFLRASDAAGHQGVSGAFDVELADDLLVRFVNPSALAALGDEVTNRIQVANSGPTEATGITLTNTLPAGHTALSASATQGVCSLSNNVVYCQLGSLASAAEVIVTVVSRADVPGPATNHVSVGRAETDPFSGNNSATAVINVLTPAIGIQDVTLAEGDTGFSVATFHLTLFPPSQQLVSVGFTTADITAQAGTDYTGASGTILFPPGTTNQTLPILVVGDEIPEIAETFSVNLSGPLHAVLARDSALGTITNDDLFQAQLPFTETWESGGFAPYWSRTGTGNFASRNTSTDAPHLGTQHLLMDSASGLARNEVTLAINLAGWTNVSMSFWAKEFDDEPNGPPPSPFATGADFDGVAISGDGVSWYEILGLRTLSSTYTQQVVDLDAVLAEHAITNRSRLRIRFNQYDDFQVPTDGIAIDDIEIAGQPLGLFPSGQALVAEQCTPANNAIDPGETVTVSLALNNRRPAATVNVIATLLASEEVVDPSGPVSYGAIPASSVASNVFTFTARADCGDNLTLRVQLQDGTEDLGTVEYTFPVGTPIPFMVEDFDSLPAPYLPAGWTVQHTGAGLPWQSMAHSNPVSPPNVVFAPNPSTSSENILLSPIFTLPGPGSRLSFQHQFGIEVCCDHAYLEISVNGTTFVNVTSRGITFSEGGYNAGTSWGGSSQGYIASTILFPDALLGSSLQLRWRLTSNASGSGAGWFIDSLSGSGGRECCYPNDLVLLGTANPDPVEVGRPLTYLLTILSTGPNASSEVTLFDTIPPGASVLSATPSQGTCEVNGDLVICSLGSMAADQSATVSLVVTPGTVGPLVNDATVIRAEDEAVFDNNAVRLVATGVPHVYVAQLPFFEGWESGQFSPYWVRASTGGGQILLTSSNAPFAGSNHLTFDSFNGFGRNELTIALNLQDQHNVVLSFHARNFGDEPHGPPPSPFLNGADFDGVAISEDGVLWYEVFPLRNLPESYSPAVVDLDAAAADHGLTYDSQFFLRFNQYDNTAIPSDGLAIDDIAITAGAPALRVQRTNDQIRVSWPAYAVTFELEFADSLVAPIDWQPVEVTPVPVGDEWVILQEAPPESRFYRLRRVIP